MNNYNLNKETFNFMAKPYEQRFLDYDGYRYIRFAYSKNILG